ncbi:DUF3298 and DUF4163 domain-containing protein [Bacillus sp. Marseille-Q3570]|uniref:DUF3298 and DUF4163 domain-containing protein n=1 Tax=Bacillus sp. Marseille-Q3570 TaxID=2963522 RepID=UPI0021B824DE|nr:DUF3298 and DUF4163 domain-containing protein [Bacillus sp. Marseille-Q3570]
MFDPIKPVKIITIKNEKGPTKVSYPKIVGMKNMKVEAQINKAIRKVVNQLKEEAEEPDTSVTITYSIKANRNGVLSIIILLDFYKEHAAHPMQVRRALTFSTLSGHHFTFSELFNPNSYYKTRLTRYVSDYIKAENIPVFDQPPKVSDKQEYYLTDEALVLYYQLYEYTPYAYGFLEIPVPFETVIPMLSRQSPIRQLTSR